MSAADRMAAVVREMGRAACPLTITELAENLGLAPSTTRTAVLALERRGEVEKTGVAMSGAQCWRLTGADQ